MVEREEMSFQEEFRNYAHIKGQLLQAIHQLMGWLEERGKLEEEIASYLEGLAESILEDRLQIAFVAEFSRGKSELINALFFAFKGLKMRLLPATPGRTTMCPTELFWDRERQESYLRLLPIGTRLLDKSLEELRAEPSHWEEIPFDPTNLEQIAAAFGHLREVMRVTVDEAKRLGLYHEDAVVRDEQGDVWVEIPKWRHALISFPHPLLKAGLALLDTPGLNALGTEPELTLNLLPEVHAILFMLSVDTGVTKSDLEVWQNHVCRVGGKEGRETIVVLNKIDMLAEDILDDEEVEREIQKQVRETARILKVEESQIFPVSAKQAFLGKIRGDEALLEKSRIQKLESHLSTVARRREEILRDLAVSGIGRILSEQLAEVRRLQGATAKQLEELKRLDIQNKNQIQEQLLRLRQAQSHYLEAIDRFQQAKEAIAQRLSEVLRTLHPNHIDAIVKGCMERTATALTTPQMKAAMREGISMFEETLLQTSANLEEVEGKVKELYGQLGKLLGIEDGRLFAPPPLHLRAYQSSFQEILEEGHAFHESLATTLLEQHIVVRRLYEAILSRIRKLFREFYQEVVNWGRTSLAPLVQQLKDRHQEIKRQIALFRRIQDAKTTLESELKTLQEEQEQLAQDEAFLKKVEELLQQSVSVASGV